MTERLNIRAAAVLLVAFLVAGGAVAGAHRWQTGRNAGGLLDLATDAESRGRPDRAARLIERYLELSPGDTDARAGYGILLERLTRDAKGLSAVCGVYEQVLERDPWRADLRTRLARLYTLSRRYSDAKPHLAALNAESAADPELAFLLATCHDGLGEAGPAEAQYRRAVLLDPKGVGLQIRLAYFLRKGTNPGDAVKANEVMDKLVEANPEDPLARLARASYRQEFKAGDPSADVAAAVRLAPKNAEVRYMAGLAAAKPEEARDHFRAALDADPRDARVHVVLAKVEAKAGNTAEAAAVLRRARARLPGNGAVLFALAELMIATRDLPEADRVAAEIDRWKLDPALAVLLRGRTRMAGGRWRAACEVLEAGRPVLTTAATGLAADADVLIGRCHEQLGEDDLAVAAYRRAAAGDAGRPDAAAGIARLLVRSGRLGEAVDYYRRLATAQDAGVEPKLMYARLRTAQYLAAPAAGRRAADLDPVFAAVAEKKPGAAELVLLRAELLFADNQPDAAARLLRDELTRRPNGIDVGLPLARILGRRGQPAEAWEVLDGLAARAGPSADLDLTRLELLPTADDPRAAAVVADVGQRAGEGEPEDRARRCVGLAETHTRWLLPAEARRWWEAVGRLRPDDIGVRFRLLDLAIQAKDAGWAAEAVREIRRADGEGAAGRYAEAIVRLVRGAQATPAELAEARGHLSAAALARPTWPLPHAGLAMVADLEGKGDDSLAGYLRAIDLGDRRPAIVRRAVQLLAERRRFPEADRLLQRLAPQTESAGPFARLAAEVSLVNQEIDRAVGLARGAVAADSKEYEEHLWQAELLAAAGRGDDALVAFRRATAVAGPNGRPWVALVRHHLRAGRPEQAERVIAELGQKLTGVELDLTLAHCHELAGRAAPAEELYRKSADARPGDPAAVRPLVAFYERSGAAARSVPALRRLLAAPPPPADVAWARRALAGALSAAGQYDGFREAVALLDQNLAEQASSPTDHVAKARVLATRLFHRRDALAVLDQLRQRWPLDPASEFLLGQLYADTGSWAVGRPFLVNAIAREGDNVGYLRFFVDRTLKNGQTDEAGLWLDRLERVAPDDPAVVGLRATWLVRRGNGAEAAELVEKRSRPAAGPKATEDLDRVREAAAMAADIGRAGGPAGAELLALAERLYRRLAGGGKLADRLALAVHLGRGGRAEEAVEVCRQAGPDADAVAVAGTLLGVAYAPADYTEAQLDLIGGELERALARVKAGPATDSIRGSWAARRGRYADAAVAFRAVAGAGDDPAAWNNLAYMLILAGSPAAEPDAIMIKVLAKVGPSAEALDTRGMLYLTCGRGAEAVADLESAVDQEPNALRLVHLSAAYENAGRRDDARKALARADVLKADGSLVLPAEQGVQDVG